jgi:hypothetical protein
LRFERGCLRPVTGPRTASHGVTLPFRVSLRVALALYWLGAPLIPFDLLRFGIQGLRASRMPEVTHQVTTRSPLMGLCSPSESTKLKRPPWSNVIRRRYFCGSSHEVSSPTAFCQHEAAAFLVGFASPGRLRPQVFSTSRRFRPPRACWPCFMPDPLLGFYPSELCSSRGAVRCLQRQYPRDVWGPDVLVSHSAELSETSSGSFVL